MKRLQICMFDSDFYLQQVRILHLDVKVKNVQLRKSTSLNLKEKLLLHNLFTSISHMDRVEQLGLLGIWNGPTSGPFQVCSLIWKYLFTSLSHIFE